MFRASISFCVTLALVLAVAADATAQSEAPPPAPVKLPRTKPDGQQPREYIFQIGLYRLKQTAEGDAAGIRHFPEHQPPADSFHTNFAHGVPHAFGSLNCEQCHVVSWPTPTHAGSAKTVAKRVVGEALTAAVAEVIAEPVLSTVEGRPAQLRLQGGETEYFVRDEDGRFRLEKAEDQSGVQVRLTVADAERENDSLNVTVDPFEIRITTLDHREPLSGSELPVGKPVFRTFDWNATLTCRPGQINAFTLDSPRQGRILVVVRLEVSDEQP